METRPNWKKVGQVLATTLLLSFCLYLTAEHIISFPIERIHFIKYSLLAFFIYFSFFSQDGSKNYLRSFIVACLLGITEETSQNFIPERFFDWWDILLNCVSCLFGTLFAALTKWWVLALRGNE
jgi:VanZ family protein